MSVDQIIDGCDRIKDWIIANNVDFSVFCIMGSSGSMLAGMLLYALEKEGIQKDFIYIAKEGEKSRYRSSRFKRSTYPLIFEPTKYLIVDDCVETGKTVVEIHNMIKVEHPRMECVGIVSFMKVPSSTKKIKLGDREIEITYLLE